MSAYHIIETERRKCVIIIVTCFIICVKYKLNRYLLLFFCCFGGFSKYLFIVLVSVLIIIAFIPLCVWKVGPNMSLIATFRTGGNFYQSSLFQS